VKVRVNLNGILTIASASLIEKREPTQQEKEEEEAQQQQQRNNMDVDSHSADKKDKSDQEAQANEPPAPEVCNFIIIFFKIKHSDKGLMIAFHNIIRLIKKYYITIYRVCKIWNEILC